VGTIILPFLLLSLRKPIPPLSPYFNQFTYVMYPKKIITKIITKKLKEMLPRIIYEKHGGFIQKR
jgi:hypothetical protein